MVQVQKLMEEMRKVMETLVEHMSEFKIRGQGHFSQSEAVEGLWFMDTIVCGMRMENFVDTGAMQNFVNQRAVKSLHNKPENCTEMCKVLKSSMMLVTRIFCSAPLRVGKWFGNMDLLLDPLEYHAMILGLEVVRLYKETPIIHESRLVFLDKARTPSTTLMMKRKLRMMPRISMIKLVEGFNKSIENP
jgi:hypothetical protein